MILSPLFMFHVFFHAPLIVWSAMVDDMLGSAK